MNVVKVYESMIPSTTPSSSSSFDDIPAGQRDDDDDVVDDCEAEALIEEIASRNTINGLKKNKNKDRERS